MKKLLLITVLTFSFMNCVVAIDDPSLDASPKAHVSARLKNLQDSLRELESVTAKDESAAMKQTYRDIISALTELSAEIDTKSLSDDEVNRRSEEINNKLNPFASGSFFS